MYVKTENVNIYYYYNLVLLKKGTETKLMVNLFNLFTVKFII